MTIFAAMRSIALGTVFLGGWTWVALLLRGFDDALGGPLPPWTRSLGFLLLVLGGTVAVWCVAEFVVRGRGTPAPFDPPRRLVAAGPYRYVRNPMYIGGAMLLLGLGLEERSPSIVLFVPVWWLLFHLFAVFYEERALRRKFGADYEEYCRRTPRWIPRLMRRASSGAAGNRPGRTDARGRRTDSGSRRRLDARTRYAKYPLRNRCVEPARVTRRWSGPPCSSACCLLRANPLDTPIPAAKQSSDPPNEW